MNRKQIIALAVGAVLLLTILVGREFLATSGLVSVVPSPAGTNLVTTSFTYPLWSVVLLALVALGTAAAAFLLRTRRRS
jgi:hypothetical protein